MMPHPCMEESGVAELSEQAVEALVRRHRELGGRIAELRDEQDAVKATIDANVQVGWKLAVDGVVALKREPNRSFDLVTAVGLLDAATKANCVVTSFDAKLVRTAVEDRGLLDECMLVSADRAPVLKL